MSRKLLMVVMLAPMLAWAQTPPTTTDWTPPPMVPASPPPTPAPEGPPPTPTAQPGTPAPPGTYAPNQPGSGYQYSPYGQGRTATKNNPPPPEIGLMVSETLFGMLSAAILIAMIPTLIVFVVLQRYYVRGISEGALAGF